VLSAGIGPWRLLPASLAPLLQHRLKGQRPVSPPCPATTDRGRCPYVRELSGSGHAVRKLLAVPPHRPGWSVSTLDERCRHHLRGRESAGAALRVPIDPNWKENRTRGWLAREFPGSTSRIEAHPFLGGAFVIAATVAILIGIALDPDWLRRAFGSCTPKPNRTARRSSAERSGGGALSNR